MGSIPIGRAISDGPLSLGYRTSGKPRAGSNPAPAATRLGSQLVSCPSPLFDGSLDWVIVHHDAVAGSSPASGTTYRSSSVVEHVNSQFVSYPSLLSAGCRLWVLVNPEIPVQIRSVARDGGAISSTPGNSTVAFLPALNLMGRRHRVIGYWFESNPGLQMPW